MTPDAARALLGVALDADWETVRRRYRERIRVVHPDVSGGSAEEAAALNVAFATLVRARREPAAPPVGESPLMSSRAIAVDVALVGNDTLMIDAPPDETFRRVLAGLDLIGEISYIDRSAPIAEAIVVLDDGTSHSLVVTFQGRGLATEVFATLEALEAVASSSPEQVLHTLARFIPPSGNWPPT
jgi:hypothetical protein